MKPSTPLLTTRRRTLAALAATLALTATACRSKSSPATGTASAPQSSSPRVPKTRPKVKMVGTVVEGDLSDAMARTTVRQSYGRFRVCYEKGLAANPKLEGRVQLELIVDANGKVSGSRDAGSELGDPKVMSCLVDSVKDLNFPARGSPVKLVHTLELVPH